VKGLLLPSHTLGLSTGAIEAGWGSWELAVQLAAATGADAIELCALGTSTIESLSAYLADGLDDLRGFSYVSVHAPAREAVGRWPEVAPLLLDLPALVATVVVHPDLVGEAELELLSRLGPRLCFENMDCTKSDGRSPGELERVYDACPDAVFCLDVAHVWTNDRSLGLADELLDALGSRLRQIHLSGIDTDGAHRPTTKADLELYAPVLERCPRAPVILESELKL
jgi:sugar phosphate isomerase/epimerase